MKKEQIVRLLEHWRRPVPASDLFRFSKVLANSKTNEMMSALYSDLFRRVIRNRPEISQADVSPDWSSLHQMPPNAPVIESGTPALPSPNHTPIPLPFPNPTPSPNHTPVVPQPSPSRTPVPLPSQNHSNPTPSPNHTPDVTQPSPNCTPIPLPSQPIPLPSPIPPRASTDSAMDPDGLTTGKDNPQTQPRNKAKQLKALSSSTPNLTTRPEPPRLRPRPKPTALSSGKQPTASSSGANITTGPDPPCSDTLSTRPEPTRPILKRKLKDPTTVPDAERPRLRPRPNDPTTSSSNMELAGSGPALKRKAETAAERAGTKGGKKQRR